MRHLLPIVLAALAILLSSRPAQACIWDRDTLATEAKGLPEVTAIIAGRFERNPPKYYEMRLARVTAQLDKTPGDLAALDDAAVACDRLGRHDDAIAWMANKRSALDAKPDKTHEYRYLANLGTFHVHRWFSNDQKREDMADLKKGEELIDKAIKLNPDAHFGRELYQLQAIRWILQQPLVDRKDGIKQVKPMLAGDGKIGKGPQEAVRGLSGLIALGAAWQSIDIFQALAEQLVYAEHNSLARMAELRVAELKKAGKKSVHAPLPVMLGIEAHGLEQEQQDEAKSVFSKARVAAQKWHQGRTEFMLAKLDKGAHPDTHKDFWTGYQDLPAMPTQLDAAKKSGCGSCAVDSSRPGPAYPWLWLSLGALLLVRRRYS